MAATRIAGAVLDVGIRPILALLSGIVPESRLVVGTTLKRHEDLRSSDVIHVGITRITVFRSHTTDTFHRKSLRLLTPQSGKHIELVPA